jgi:hypothetical protein
MAKNYDVRVVWHMPDNPQQETIVPTSATTTAIALKVGRHIVLADHKGACIDKSEIFYPPLAVTVRPDSPSVEPIEEPLQAGPHQKVVVPTTEFKPIRNGTKKDMIIGMMQRLEGATIDEVVSATGWTRRTVRGVFSGSLKKKLRKLGLTFVPAKEERGRVYHIVDQNLNQGRDDVS